MGTKLVRLDVPDGLHKRIKTLAAYHDKKIPEYMLEILEDHVPKEIHFPEDDSADREKRLPS